MSVPIVNLTGTIRVAPAIGENRGDPRFGTSFTGIMGENSQQVVLESQSIPGAAPQVVTIQLGRFDRVGGGDNCQPVGVVQFGCGGSMNLFEVDWQYGASISLVCDSYCLSVRSEKADPLIPYSQTIGYQLKASVGSGSVSVAPVKTAPFAQILALGTAFFQVPAFADGMRCLVGDVAVDSSAIRKSASVKVYCISSFLSNCFDLSQVAPQDWQPVVPGTGVVAVENLTAGVIKAAIQYRLAL